MVFCFFFYILFWVINLDKLQRFSLAFLYYGVVLLTTELLQKGGICQCKRPCLIFSSNFDLMLFFSKFDEYIKYHYNNNNNIRL